MRVNNNRWLAAMAGAALASGFAFSAVAAKPPAASAPPPNKAAREELAPMDQPLIRVDGYAVTSREYANYLQSHPETLSRAANTEEGKAAALREVVTAYLLQKAMYSEGLLNKAQKEPSQNTIIAAYEKLAERHFPLPPTPDDTAGYAYYQAHPGEYGIPAMVRLSQIFFKAAPDADSAVLAAARDKGEQALKRLAAGEAFAAVATSVTENPLGKVTGGDIGFVDIEQEDWARQALKDLKTGERTGLVRTPSGFVICEVTDLRPGLISPYANVRDKVIKTLRDKEQAKLRDAYVRELAKSAKIEVVAPSVQPLFPKGVFE